MSYQEPLSKMCVAISISESADMAIRGMAKEHLQDAMVEVARHLLAMGARLIYGGDLRADGFTELLFELVVRHRRDADLGDKRSGVASYLPWAILGKADVGDIKVLEKKLAGIVDFHCLDEQGEEIPMVSLAKNSPPPSKKQIANSLTAMRKAIVNSTNARVVLGGRIKGFEGRMPGIAEEALLSLEASQPIFLLGGFGGCTRDIAEDMKLLPLSSRRQIWNGRKQFRQYNPSSLKNGLTLSENHTLAGTVHIDEAIALILRGLLRLNNRKATNSTLLNRC